MVRTSALLLASAPAALALVLPDGVGKLPALGWNSWNAFACDINEEKFLTAANKFVELGFKDAGYEYVNIDDCWSIKDHRDNVTGRIIPDTAKFPDGINGTAAKIHDLGLKIGIYSSAGTETCAGYPASLEHEEVDAAAWAEWGIDYLKYDNCGVPESWVDECKFCVPDRTNVNVYVNGTCTNTTGLCPEGYDFHKSKTAERYNRMRDALAAQDRVIQYSLCVWGQADASAWGNETGNSWRMSGDITADWARILEILNENSFLLNSVDFWGHSDADMLEVGNGNLTLAESRSHFALWAAMKSPLLIGTALDTLAADFVDVLLNKHLLVFHQDAVFGAPAQPYKWGTNPDWTFDQYRPAEYWAGDSVEGTLVLLLNTDNATATKEASWDEVPGLQAAGEYDVVDVWSGEDLGCKKDGVTVDIEAHDTAVFLVKEGCGSEIKKWARQARPVDVWML
ncbi:glycoside hydrolase family 27 protein [Aplosporella prunicola CBS 121167]|uniref:Alpha-galactosidase n=1 Tax=Aplosporella prunicola CBS 121167 TaxID=1176127 RepID=A0A6A6BKF5_9PEZI|nr:glycoside hydrolase family 27 protein [Aplosporella prunicola CBS 121167]KAF2143327.1 glycoside hydrolase family 27 protein [Aplosporella prunicola CBS 121167]